MILVYIILSALLGLLIGPKYIGFLRKVKMGQFIREAGPNSHSNKAGTPTMGGGIFLLSVMILSLIMLDLGNIESWLLILAMVLFAFVGAIDDLAKLRKKQNEGLTSKQKMILQLGFSLIVVLLYYFKVGDTSLWIPFVDKTFELGWFYIVFMLFVVVGASNATNLTDGLDGLLSTNAIISFLGFALVAIQLGNTQVEIFSWLMVGALIAFLVFNFNPARVFMGDMGSLSIGAILAVSSMILKIEIVLIFLGAIYVIETLSVIMQVISFKLFRKRIFKMSPIHHHFEIKGMHEREVVYMFASIQFAMVLLAVIMI